VEQPKLATKRGVRRPCERDGRIREAIAEVLWHVVDVCCRVTM
jgi:hypothetical protein